MFVETKQEGEAQVDLHSIANLIAWLEQRPAKQAYDFCDAHDCLIARYLRDHGVAADHAVLDSTEAWAFFGDDGFVIYQPGGKSTYGAALERAREVVGGRCSPDRSAA